MTVGSDKISIPQETGEFCNTAHAGDAKLACADAPANEHSAASLPNLGRQGQIMARIVV
jgi:hypothetical protein